MGWRFEVNVWNHSDDGYHWLQVYCGESMIKAMYKMWQAKRHGYGCIKLEWRP